MIRRFLISAVVVGCLAMVPVSATTMVSPNFEDFVMIVESIEDLPVPLADAPPVVRVEPTSPEEPPKTYYLVEKEPEEEGEPVEWAYITEEDIPLASFEDIVGLPEEPFEEEAVEEESHPGLTTRIVIAGVALVGLGLICYFGFRNKDKDE